MKRILLAAILAVAVNGLGGMPAAWAQEKEPVTVGTIAALPVASFYTHEGAETLYRQAKYAQAEAMCKKAVEEIEKAKGPNSYTIAEPLIDLATVYMRQAKHADAKACIDRAESLLDKTKPEQALLYGRLGINKGWRLYILGETAAAAKVCTEARDLLIANKVKESKDLAELTNNLGLMNDDLAEEEGRPQLIRTARQQLLEGYTMRTKLTGEESPETGESLNNLGMHMMFSAQSITDVDLGFNTLTKSLEVAKKVYGTNHPETAVARATMALAYYMTDQLELAEKEIELALPVTEQFMGKVHPDRAYELTTLARIRMRQQRFSDAEKYFAEVVTINEQVYGKTSPHVLPSLEALKRFYDERGDAGKSRDVDRRIEGIKGKDI